VQGNRFDRGHDAFFNYVDRWMTEDDTHIVETINAEYGGRGLKFPGAPEELGSLLPRP